MEASPSTATPSPLKFIREQLDVIDEPVGARQFVEAGPGTGKTAVACARIAKLLRDGVNPSKILMISFTRTAVRELRERIRSWSGNGAGALNVYTIDQTAFRFVNAATGAKVVPTAGYEVTIEAAIEELRSGTGNVVDYVRSLQHVLVDEAQDITDARVDFVSLLIHCLNPDAGATILADPCQAIFGFTRDHDDADSAPVRLFLQAFPFKKLGFVERHLTVLHRTSSKPLVHLFAGARKKMLTTSGESALRGVVDEIVLGKSLGSKIEEFGLERGNLIVFRKRVQAVQAAHYFKGLHRLRLPGYPAAVYPWVALCFSKIKSTTVSQATFEGLWKNNVAPPLADGWSATTAFETLKALARSGENVDIRRLRMLIASPQPPPDICYSEFGATGPIFSTIHAAKGREADRVVLMLPRKIDDAVEYAAKKGEAAVTEEARVYYVGATRVKKDFAHGTANTLIGARKLGRDREVMLAPRMGETTKFQIGRVGDLAEERAVSSREPWCGDDDIAHSRQQALIRLWSESVSGNRLVEVTGKSTKVKVGGKDEYHYQFVAGDNFLAWSGVGLGSDLWKIANQLQTKFGGRHTPPKTIPYLQLIGMRTVAVSDESVRAELCAPHCDSGFFLAPMISGFAHAYI